MTTAAVEQPPKPAAPAGGDAVAVPDPEWRVADRETRCRDRHGAAGGGDCGAVAAAEKSHPSDPISPWWGYCREHARRQGRWVQGGKVMRWALRHADGTLLREEEAARVRRKHAGKAGKTGEPEARGTQSFRARGDTMADVKRAAASWPSVNEWIERVTEAAVGYVRCRRGSCHWKTPPVPVGFGDLAGKTFGEWVAQAVELVESQHPRHEPVTVGVSAAARPTPLGAVPFRSPAVTR